MLGGDLAHEFAIPGIDRQPALIDQNISVLGPVAEGPGQHRQRGRAGFANSSDRGAAVQRPGRIFARGVNLWRAMIVLVLLSIGPAPNDFGGQKILVDERNLAASAPTMAGRDVAAVST